jgi:exopolysaccharide biosynthesis polyprenyl glycosylphosphotransferase
VLIVGAGQRGLALAQEMQEHPEHGYRVVGFVEDDPEKIASSNGFKVLGDTSAILELAERHAVDEIVIAYAPSWQEKLLRDLLLTGQDERVHVKVLPTLYEAVIGGLPTETIQDIPLLRLNGRKPSAAYLASKRVLDVVVSLGILAITAPAVALAALAVKLTSPGPAFFRQRRVGLGGREFTIYKLRTMILDAESHTGPVLATEDDERVTPVGRFLRRTRLDEIPQLFNVLRGEMAVVGPRPERPEFVKIYLREVAGYRKRLEVKPGVTGLAQVYGGYLTSVYDKLKYDWMYVYKRSLLLDLKILWLTVGVVLARSGY